MVVINVLPTFIRQLWEFHFSNFGLAFTKLPDISIDSIYVYNSYIQIIYLSAYLPIYLPTYPSTYLSIYLSVYLSIYNIMIYLWSPQLSKSSPSTPPSVDAATARRGPTARDARGGPGHRALRGVLRWCSRAPRKIAARCGGQRLLRHGAGGPPSNPESW